MKRHERLRRANWQASLARPAAGGAVTVRRSRWALPRHFLGFFFFARFSRAASFATSDGLTCSAAAKA